MTYRIHRSMLPMTLRMCFLLLCCYHVSIGQHNMCLNSRPRSATVMAQPSLNLRVMASLSDSVLCQIPSGEHILVCQRPLRPDTIANQSGFWYRALYGDIWGFVFSSYLRFEDEKYDDVRIIFPNVGMIDEGLPASERTFYQIGRKYEDKRTSLSFIPEKISSNEIKSIDFSEYEDVFLISGIERSKFHPEIKGRFWNEKFVPSESNLVHSYYDQHYKKRVEYYAYATGYPRINKDKNQGHIFDGIEDYKFFIRRFVPDSEPIDHLIFQANLHNFHGGYAGGASLRWVGKLNNDDWPDFIIKTSTHYAGWAYYLLISDPGKGTNGYHLVLVGHGSSC